MRAEAEIKRLDRYTWMARVYVNPSVHAVNVYARTRRGVERKARRAAKLLVRQAEWWQTQERVEVTP